MITLSNARKIITAAEKKAAEIGQPPERCSSQCWRKPCYPRTYGWGMDRER